MKLENILISLTLAQNSKNEFHKIHQVYDFNGYTDWSDHSFKIQCMKTCALNKLNKSIMFFIISYLYLFFNNLVQIHYVGNREFFPNKIIFLKNSNRSLSNFFLLDLFLVQIQNLDTDIHSYKFKFRSYLSSTNISKEGEEKNLKIKIKIYNKNI